MEAPGVVRDTDNDLESSEMDAVTQPQALPTAMPSVWVATPANRMSQQEFIFWVSFLQYVVVNNTFAVHGLVANLQLSISPKNGSGCLQFLAADNFGSYSSNSACAYHRCYVGASLAASAAKKQVSKLQELKKEASQRGVKHSGVKRDELLARLLETYDQELA
jgi:hypothetical protein